MNTHINQHNAESIELLVDTCSVHAVLPFVHQLHDVLVQNSPPKTLSIITTELLLMEQVYVLFPEFINDRPQADRERGRTRVPNIADIIDSDREFNVRIEQTPLSHRYREAFAEALAKQLASLTRAHPNVAHNLEVTQGTLDEKERPLRQKERTIFNAWSQLYGCATGLEAKHTGQAQLFFDPNRTANAFTPFELQAAAWQSTIRRSCVRSHPFATTKKDIGEQTIADYLKNHDGSTALTLVISDDTEARNMIKELYIEDNNILSSHRFIKLLKDIGVDVTNKPRVHRPSSPAITNRRFNRLRDKLTPSYAPPAEESGISR